MNSSTLRVGEISVTCSSVRKSLGCWFDSQFKWLPVKFRIDFKVLLITYKALRGLVPEYITEIIAIRPKSRYNLRSDSELLLQKPKVKSLSTLGDRSFAFAALHSGTSYPQKYGLQRPWIVLRNS